MEQGASTILVVTVVVQVSHDRNVDGKRMKACSEGIRNGSAEAVCGRDQGGWQLSKLATRR